MTFVCITPEQLAWGPVVIYFLAGWAQIFKNWQNHSARAVSYHMVFLSMTGNFSKMLYNYFLDLPLAYRLMRPLILVVVAVLMVQGYVYAENKSIKRNMLVRYGVLFSFCWLFMGLGYYYPIGIGNLSGWISIIALSVYQIPQVVKNYRRQSVRGLSFVYLSMLCVGAVLEFSVGFLLVLPVQSILNGLRGVSYYLVFCYQFWLYGDRAESRKNRVVAGE